MAVVRGWTELAPSKTLDSFLDNVLVPLLAPPKVKRLGATKASAIRAHESSIWMINLVPKQR